MGHWLSSSLVGLMATPSKMAHATPRTDAPRAPMAVHCWPVPPQETFNTQRQVWLRLCGVFWCIQLLFEPSECVWEVWSLVLSVISPFLPSYWCFSFALGCGVSFLGGIQHSSVNGSSAVSCIFGVLAGENEHMSLYSTIFIWNQHPKKKSLSS